MKTNSRISVRTSSRTPTVTGFGRYTAPVSWRFSGNSDLSQTYKGFAQTLIGSFRNRMSLSGQRNARGHWTQGGIIIQWNIIGDRVWCEIETQDGAVEVCNDFYLSVQLLTNVINLSYFDAYNISQFDLTKLKSTNNIVQRDFAGVQTINRIYGCDYISITQGVSSVPIDSPTNVPISNTIKLESEYLQILFLNDKYVANIDSDVTQFHGGYHIKRGNSFITYYRVITQDYKIIVQKYTIDSNARNKLIDSVAFYDGDIRLSTQIKLFTNLDLMGSIAANGCLVPNNTGDHTVFYWLNYDLAFSWAFTITDDDVGFSLTLDRKITSQPETGVFSNTTEIIRSGRKGTNMTTTVIVGSGCLSSSCTGYHQESNSNTVVNTESSSSGSNIIGTTFDAFTDNKQIYELKPDSTVDNWTNKQSDSVGSSGFASSCSPNICLAQESTTHTILDNKEDVYSQGVIYESGSSSPIIGSSEFHKTVNASTDYNNSAILNSLSTRTELIAGSSFTIVDLSRRIFSYNSKVTTIRETSPVPTAVYNVFDTSIETTVANKFIMNVDGQEHVLDEKPISVANTIGGISFALLVSPNPKWTLVSSGSNGGCDGVAHGETCTETYYEDYEENRHYTI